MRTAMTLAAALVLSPVVRGVTIEFNQSVGRVWPFSMGHCVSPTTPGCGTETRLRVSAITASLSTRATR